MQATRCGLEDFLCKHYYQEVDITLIETFESTLKPTIPIDSDPG
jgi:hypothetical protein